MNKRQNLSIYEHIWRAMALVVIAVFLLGGTAVTIYVDRTLTAQIEEQEYAALANADAIIANQLSSAQQTLNMLLTNPFVVQSIYTANEKWTSGTYQSGQTVVNAVNSNHMYNSIYVIADDEIVIKSSRRYQTQEDEQMLIDAMRMRFREAIIPWKTETGSRTTHNLMVLSALETVGLPNTTGGAMINIDLDKLASVAFAGAEGRGMYMVFGEQVIASSQPGMFFADVAENEALMQAHINGKNRCGGYRVYARANETYGYTLYCVQHSSALMVPVISGLAVMLAVLCALLLVSLLISRKAALHAYTPVKTVLVQIEEQLPADPESAAHETADGLSDIQRAARRIRRTSEMVSAYRKDADTVRLSRFIHNGTQSPRVAEILHQHLNCTGGEALFVLLFEAAVPEDAHMATDVLQASMAGVARFLTLDMPGQRLLSLACAERGEVSEQYVKQNVEQVIRLMRDERQGRVIIALGTAEGGLQTLPAAYGAIVERMRGGVFCRDSAMLCQSTESALPEEVVQRMQTAMTGPDDAEFDAAARDYLACCSRIDVGEAYHELATLCMRAIEAEQRPGGDLSARLETYRSTLRALSELPDYAALTAYLAGLRQTALRSMRAQSTEENNPLAEMIVAYMRAHFENPMLSAAEVAEATNISVSHLSRVMKRSVGCGFPEMLQTIRMERACEQLIAQPDIPIAQLAQQCGFSSASYFTASFKKKFGVTPSGYRQKQSAEE